jgi:hypothetical protein
MSIGLKGVPPEDIEKIRTAAPSRPIVDPAKQRKLLVYSATRMYYQFAYRRSVAPIESLTLPESLGSGIGMSAISNLA